jgi:outer membrane protein OmpA-like peptidoglycan-associated protein
MKSSILLIFLSVFLLNVFSQEKENSFNLYFKFNSTNLVKKSETNLIDFIKEAKEKGYKVTIETSCDTLGPIIYNDYLSSIRLKSLSTKFYSQGISIDKLVSRGEIFEDKRSLSSNRKAIIRFAEIAIDKKQVEEKVKNVDISQKFKDVLSNKSIVEPIVLAIQFVPGEDVFLNDSAYSEANDLYNFLNENKNVTAFIRGHVCCKNDPVLATQRAYAVYNYLLNKKIEPQRLDFEGFSNTMPIAFPENSEVERQMNRRVDVIFKIVNL